VLCLHGLYREKVIFLLVMLLRCHRQPPTVHKIENVEVINSRHASLLKASEGWDHQLVVALREYTRNSVGTESVVWLRSE
jgi:hypothetical protein